MTSSQVFVATLRFTSFQSDQITSRDFMFNSMSTSSFHFTSEIFTSLHFTSLHFTSLHFTSLRFNSFQFMSGHCNSFSVASFHFISLRFTCAMPLPWGTEDQWLRTSWCRLIALEKVWSFQNESLKFESD